MITINMLKEAIENNNKKFEFEIHKMDALSMNRLINQTELLENVIYNLKKINVDSVDAIVVTDIEWDEHPVDLPAEVRIDIDISNFELLKDFNGYASVLVDYLTDRYECCVCNFSIGLD